MKNPILRSKVALATLVFFGLAFQGCQTTAVPNRDPASGAGLTPANEQMLRNDVFEAFGIAARGVLYEKRVGRALVVAGLAPAAKSPADWGQVAWHTALGSGLASVAAGGLGAIAESTEISGKGFKPLFARLTTRYFKGDNSTASIGLSSAAGPILASSLGVFLTAFVSPEDARAEGNEGIGGLHFIFRRTSYLDAAQKAADLHNAKAQADFVAALKASATELARRWATLLRLQPSETTSLEIKFETKMLEEFKSEETWRAGDEAKIDVRKILRLVVVDADARYKALEVIVQSVAGGEAKAITDIPGALGYYDEEIKQLQALDAAVLAKYKELVGSKVPALKAMANDYYAYSTEIEKFQRTLELHRKLLAEGGKR